MPLTEQQIEELFTFTRKKYVHYYDLQQELVDHLACSIEEEMASDQRLSFENALQKVYSRFGIFGFAKVVQEKSAALHKNNWRIWRSAVKEFFTLPKVAFTATIYFAALFIGKNLNADFKASLSAALWLIYMIYSVYELKSSRKKTYKKLLLTQPTSFSSSFGFIWPQFFIGSNWDAFHNNYYFATVFALIIILESAILKVNKTIRKKAVDLYPEAFVAD